VIRLGMGGVDLYELREVAAVTQGVKIAPTYGEIHRMAAV